MTPPKSRKSSDAPSLFELPPATHAPLAERLRPCELSDIVGQEHVLGEDGVIARMARREFFASIVFWGPPGCGKTTLARILAEKSGCVFEAISAVSSGVAELKAIFERARERLRDGLRTIVFVDEIHRFNRAQQDAFLPVVEDGTILLMGATTENPSFELNSALLSRMQVIVLHPLGPDDLRALILRAEAEMGRKLPLTDAARDMLLRMADGDGRALINLCEILFAYQGAPLDETTLPKLVQKRAPIYDKHEEQHYNLISALHKSLRGSDPDAALYWLARMLAGGENPLYIARRLVRFAVEDIGLADPQAVTQALAAKDCYDFLGSPEGELAIAQAVLYLATAPKSNAAYRAFQKAAADADRHGSLPPPLHILNAPTGLMRNLGYGKDYEYDHDTEQGFSGQHYFPDGMARRQYYQPAERGFEREIMKRLEYWARLREKRKVPEQEH